MSGPAGADLTCMRRAFVASGCRTSLGR